MTPMLSVSDLTLALPRRGEPPRIAARSVSFDVAPGEAFALLGVAGSGKSAVLSALGGLLPQGARLLGGRVLLDPGTDRERDLLRSRAARWRALRRGRVACLFAEEPGWWNPILTMRGHLLEALARGDRAGEMRSESAWMPELYEAGLIEPEKLLDRRAAEVSDLVRLRVRVAMALLAGADLWLVDGVTENLDANGREQAARLLRELCEKRGLALVCACREIGTVERIADRVAVLYEGGVVESGRVADLIRRPKTRYTRALLDCLPRIGERRARLGEIDRVAERDAIDATRGVGDE